MASVGVTLQQNLNAVRRSGFPSGSNFKLCMVSLLCLARDSRWVAASDEVTTTLALRLTHGLHRHSDSAAVVLFRVSYATTMPELAPGLGDNTVRRIVYLHIQSYSACGHCRHGSLIVAPL